MTDSAARTAAPAGLAAGLVDSDRVTGWLADLFAPWVQDLRLAPLQVAPGEVTLSLPFDAALSRVGGTLCGQALVSAADTAMVLAVLAQLGEFRPLTTASMNASFLRAIAGGDARVHARVIKPGRTLTFCEATIAGADGKPAVHATATYAML